LFGLLDTRRMSLPSHSRLTTPPVEFTTDEVRATVVVLVVGGCGLAVPVGDAGTGAVVCTAVGGVVGSVVDAGVAGSEAPGGSVVVDRDGCARRAASTAEGESAAGLLLPMRDTASHARPVAEAVMTTHVATSVARLLMVQAKQDLSQPSLPDESDPPWSPPSRPPSSPLRSRSPL
jgi:hypothetical protein